MVPHSGRGRRLNLTCDQSHGRNAKIMSEMCQLEIVRAASRGDKRSLSYNQRKARRFLALSKSVQHLRRGGGGLCDGRLPTAPEVTQ